MEEEIRNSTEVVKNTSELANNFNSGIRPIVQPVTKCIGAVLDLALSPLLFIRKGSDFSIVVRQMLNDE